MLKVKIGDFVLLIEILIGCIGKGEVRGQQ